MKRVDIGNASLYLGDCLDILPDLERCDALVTDPPYSSGGFNEMGKAGGSIGTTTEAYRPILGDTMSTGGYFDLMHRVLRLANPLACYLFTDWRMWRYTAEAVELSGLRLRGMIVWNKGSGGMGARWKAAHELVCWGTRVVSPMGEGEANVITCGRSGNVEHPTEKPLKVMSTIIGNAEGESVLDPFMGSGTTGVAAALAGKRFIGIELDPAHFETACRRIAEAQGQQSRGKQSGLFEDAA
jgi:site-specific DNA-methyltransferase (adenine-specific)